MSNIRKIRPEQEHIPYKAKRSVPSGRTLILAPHADDEIFGCGGAMIRCVQQNDVVKTVIVTDSGYPVTDEQKNPDYPEIRKRESIAAAKIIGCGEPEFLDFHDRSLVLDKKLVNSIQSIIESSNPSNIYYPADSEIHPDHRILNKAVQEALKNVTTKTVRYLISYEISAPLSPNYLHDITDIAEILLSAMNCFKSQLKVQDYRKKIMALNTYRTYTLPKEVLFAEAYAIQSVNTNRLGIFRGRR